jgi:hypothetical protein
VSHQRSSFQLKVSGKCCFIISRGITRLIIKTHTNSTSCFGMGSVVLRFGVDWFSN